MTAAGSADGTAFDHLMAEVMAGAERFGHRQHVELAWLAVRRHGAAEAVTLLCDGIRKTAAAAGAPEKFDQELTLRWLALVAARASSTPDAPDAAAFLARHPDLLDPHLLRRPVAAPPAP